MADLSDDDLRLDLGGVEDEQCSEWIAAERVHYASSVAESLVVFANRIRCGETCFDSIDVLQLTNHFMEMLERRERVCPCCPELHDGER